MIDLATPAHDEDGLLNMFGYLDKLRGRRTRRASWYVSFVAVYMFDTHMYLDISSYLPNRAIKPFL